MAVLVDGSNDINRREWCSISYKMRCFYSKGAFLFWMSLISLTFAYLCFVIMFTVVLYCFFLVGHEWGVQEASNSLQQSLDTF